MPSFVEIDDSKQLDYRIDVDTSGQLTLHKDKENEDEVSLVIRFKYRFDNAPPRVSGETIQQQLALAQFKKNNDPVLLEPLENSTAQKKSEAVAALLAQAKGKIRIRLLKGMVLPALQPFKLINKSELENYCDLLSPGDRASDRIWKGLVDLYVHTVNSVKRSR